MTTLAAPWFLPLLFVTGLTAGWVDAITGGGGLVVLPVFLALGIPPHLALGTNMLQSSAGTLAAAYTFIRQQQVDFRTMRLGMVWTLVGANGGARAVQRLDPTGLKTLLPFVPAGIVLYTICCPQVGSLDAPPRMSRRMFYLLAGLGSGSLMAFLELARAPYGRWRL